METTTKREPKSARDIAYYTQRYRNRVFAKLVSFVADQLEKGGLTKKDIAERLKKDPAQITRWLSQPGNMTLDTISALALAFDAEAEPPDFVLFEDRTVPNFIHPLIARVTQTKVAAPKLEAFPNSPSQPIAGANSNEWRVVVGGS
ncbi:MAG TPA: helix-turn-helix domain-containing protein [Rhizomicrobium sp.]|jgi:transcriptional regulator with XRE-family HTH domain|nr:helix-turn-helix domain-containing protein [Rhizomicrobium sp.]